MPHSASPVENEKRKTKTNNTTQGKERALVNVGYLPAEEGRGEQVQRNSKE